MYHLFYWIFQCRGYSGLCGIKQKNRQRYLFNNIWWSGGWAGNFPVHIIQSRTRREVRLIFQLILSKKERFTILWLLISPRPTRLWLGNPMEILLPVWSVVVLWPHRIMEAGLFLPSPWDLVDSCCISAPPTREWSKVSLLPISPRSLQGEKTR